MNLCESVKSVAKFFSGQRRFAQIAQIRFSESVVLMLIKLVYGFLKPYTMKASELTLQSLGEDQSSVKSVEKISEDIVHGLHGFSRIREGSRFSPSV